MVHSVELVFDESTETAIRVIWAGLADAGLPSQQPTTRPHATMTVAERIDDAVDTVLAPLADRLPLPCTIAAPVLFGRDRVVLARLLVPSIELLDLHAEVHRRCLPQLSPAPMPHTAPGHWTGHVTLARRLRPAQLAHALRIAARPAEITGSVIGLRRWDGDRRTEHPIG